MGEEQHPIVCSWWRTASHCLFLMKNSIPLFVLDEEQHPIVCSWWRTASQLFFIKNKQWDAVLHHVRMNDQNLYDTYLWHCCYLLFEHHKCWNR
jgi:hypothetical protein